MKSGTVLASLMVDDGSPINLMTGHAPLAGHRFLVPNRFTLAYARLCEKHGVRGKFSVVPMPLALGRLDERINGVSSVHLRRFLNIARERIAPNFDISPELLTHLTAVDSKGGYAHHLFEDLWVERATSEQIADLIALALRILDNVGLPANGVTSPWMTGRNNRETYGRGISLAHWMVYRRKRVWYMLDVDTIGPGRWPVVTHRGKKRGQTLTMVVANTDDVWWNVQKAGTAKQAKQVAEAGTDSLLNERGEGRLRMLAESGTPLTILTHWQSLFDNGRASGLAGLALLLKRMDKAFGKRLRWVRSSELAVMAIRRRTASKPASARPSAAPPDRGG